jgi:hypothetical protein
MKLKILSIEPNWDDLPAMNVAVKAYAHFEMRQIVKWQITEHKDTGMEGPIEGETWTTKREGSAILEAVKQDAVKRIHQCQEMYKAAILPGQEFELVPVEELAGKEFELGDKI